MSLYSENLTDLVTAEFYEEDEPVGEEFEDGVSTYEVAEDQCPQAIAEHRAAAKNDPPRATGVVDVTALKYTVTPDDPRGPFSFINSAHKLLDVEPTHAGLRQLAEQMLELLQVHGAGTEIPGERMREHVRARVQVDDAEWLAFLKHANERWRKFAGHKPP